MDISQEKDKHHSLLIREVLHVGVYFFLEHLQSDQVFRREGGGVYLVGSLQELLAFHLPITHTHTHTHTQVTKGHVLSTGLSTLEIFL